MNNGRPQRRASPTEMWIYLNPVDWSYQGSHDRGFQGERRLRSCRYAFYERHMMKKYILAMAVCLAAVATPVLATDFKVEEATIPEIEQAFRDHRLTCHQLVQTYFDRIAAYDKQGPKLNAVLALNGSALAAADLLDNSFAHGGKLGALPCVPVVLKDNYNTTDLPTTGGSLSLEGGQPGKDAFVVAQLRSAGAIILAKRRFNSIAPCSAPSLVLNSVFRRPSISRAKPDLGSSIVWPGVQYPWALAAWCPVWLR